MDKPQYHVVSFSGGKDSTAMLLRMIELGMQIDCILFCDTGLEFPDMYIHIDQVEHNIGRKITRVRCDQSYEYLMFDIPVKRKANTVFAERYGNIRTGYGWAGPRMRWCTAKLKDGPRERFLRPLRKKYDVLEYIGIAADEGYRLERKCNKAKHHVHPLVDWGWSEADCLNYCRNCGYDWNGLYEHFKRVSCWCCPLQSLAELRQLYTYYPELWSTLKEWDLRTWRKFRADFSVKELEARFEYEKQRLADGLPITGKAFFDGLKNRLDETANE